MTPKKARQIAAGLLVAVPSLAGAQGYPSARVENHTVNDATVHIEYISCRGDNIAHIPAMYMKAVNGDSAETVISAGVPSARRGACLIRRIDAGFTKGDTKTKITSYTSSGTSYNQFMIMPWAEGYRVFSRQEYAAETSRGQKSPGFDIENKTNWPVSIALSQVGCLYYGTVKPGEHFIRRTGAVWFTIEAHIQPDGKESRKDTDCIAPVAAVVGGIFIAAASAGTLTKLGVGVAAAGTGAAAATKAAVTGKMVAIAAAKAGAKSLATFGAGAIGNAMRANGVGQLKNQYAGYEWPFRCDKMPTYEITGGWGGYMEEKAPDGTVTMGIGEGTPLKITKTNTCGNEMGGLRQLP
ncbi:MAG: hypothetical protein U9Q74_14550 [Gemmatimonadota bacterium]|nr:hypothetical protein [Gemmatimonadota bacterium]